MSQRLGTPLEVLTHGPEGFTFHKESFGGFLQVGKPSYDRKQTCFNNRHTINSNNNIWASRVRLSI